MCSKNRVFSLVLVINIEIAKPNTSFWALKTMGTYLNNVFFCYNCNTKSHLCLFSLVVITDLCFIHFSNQVSRISLIFVLFLLFLLLGLIGRLEILDRNLSLEFIPAMIFYCSLSLNFVCNSMRRLTFLKDLLIGFSYVET